MCRLTYRAEGDGVKAVWYGEREVFLEGEVGYAEADKLAHYEDLEEQGRLIELPCLPNEEVWESNKRFGTHKTMYASREAIIGAIEAGYAIGYTQEAAETKLAKMNCERNICYQQDYNGGCDTCPCNDKPQECKEENIQSMTNQEIIEQLKSLKCHCEDFMDEEGSVWAKDVEALDRAIEAVEKQATSDWIPVSERLPSEADFIESYRRNKYLAEFIVMIEGATRPTTLYFRKTGIWVDENGDPYRVTAWQPLPEPYKENE